MSKELEIKNQQDEILHPVINMEKVFNAIYPIGAVYISVSNIGPDILFGGTWESIGQGRTLVGIDSSDTDFDVVEKIGGHKKLQEHNHGNTGSTTPGATGSTTPGVTGNNSAAHTHTTYMLSHPYASPGTHLRTFAITDWRDGQLAPAGTTRVGHNVSNRDGTSGNNSANHTHTSAAHTHTSAAHIHSISNAGTGNSENLQPYITVFMWKRVA